MIIKINIRDSYKFYKNTVEGAKDIKTYMNVATGYLKFLSMKLLEGFQVQLSNGSSLGTFAIVGKKLKPTIDENGKVRGLAPDWKSTMELWGRDATAKENKTMVYYLNEHTAGYKYNLVWWKTDMKIGNKFLYSFTFCKPVKRALSKMLREGKEYLTHT
jgi:hypothetical protein